MIFWSLFSWSVVTLCTALIHNTHELLATRIVLGFAESAYLPAAIGFIADHHEPKSRGTALGLHLAGLNFGLVAGGAGAGYMGEHFGWRAGFVVLGGVGLLLAAIAYFSLHDAGQPRNAASRSGVRDLLELVRIPSFVIILTEAMLISIGTWVFFNWLPLYFKERYQMSLTLAGFSGTFIPQIAATAGVVLGGYASDRFSRGHSERRLLIMGSWYLISAPFLFAFVLGPGAAVLSVCILAYSLARALGSSNEGPLLCDLLQPRLRSTAIALCNTANCFAAGVGVLLTGYLKRDFGLADTFTFISLIIVVAAGVSFAGYVFFVRTDLQRFAADNLLSRTTSR